MNREQAGWLLLALGLVVAVAIPLLQPAPGAPSARPAATGLQGPRSLDDLPRSGGKLTSRIAADIASDEQRGNRGLLLPASSMMPMQVDWVPAAPESAPALLAARRSEAPVRTAAAEPARPRPAVLPPSRAVSLPLAPASVASLPAEEPAVARPTVLGFPVPRPLATVRNFAADAVGVAADAADATLSGAGRLLPRWAGGRG